ncbi:MAG: DUF1028 domain-containing protein [Solirubrobacteraceae bacterium]
MTASIVARDARTGELGVAVFTAYPSVGMRVPFAEPGVGVVTSQGLTDRSFGAHALQRLRAGASSAEVVEELVGADPAAPTRQVAVLSAKGEAAGFTGEACVPYVGEAVGEGCRCQANMMAAPEVPEAMHAAFVAAEGDLSVRLLSALEGGQAAGGDARGRMSAALLVVPGTGQRWEVKIDVRVDHHDDPLPELRRALDFHRAFALLDVAAEHGRAGDRDGAMRAGMEALTLAPDNPQLLLWMGLGAADGNLEIGVNLVRRALKLQPSLGGFLDRIPATLMPRAPQVRAKLSGDTPAVPQ